MGARAQSLLRHGTLQQALAVGGKIAVGADLPGRHLGVAINPLAGGGEAVELDLPRLYHPLADLA